MSSWIETATKLPVPLEDVLIAYEFDGMPTIDLAYWRPGDDLPKLARAGRGAQAHNQGLNEFILTGSEPEIVVKPTHWMPLPAVPTKKERWPCGHVKVHPDDELCRWCPPS